MVSPFYGFSLRPGTEKIVLGNYAICTKPYVEQNYPDVKDHLHIRHSVGEGQIAAIDFYYVVRENVLAKDIAEAKETFNREIIHFIDALLYSIPARLDENRKISIWSEDMSQMIFIKSASGAQHSWSRSNLTSPVYIMDQKVLEEPGNDIRLFRFLDSDPASNLERRIKRAVSWVGQALRNLDLTEGFLELAIALETLLIFQDGFVSKSIVAQLAEFAAFLCETDSESRKKVNQKVKDLYKKRSGIVHSFETNIEFADFADLVRILRKIVREYFRLIDEKNLRDLAGVNSHIENLRFS